MSGVRVLRVEHYRERTGPYTWLVDPWSEADDFELRAQRPLPTEDGLPMPAPRVLCAFVSFRQFRSWFPRRVRDSLDRHGFVLAVYEVEPGALRVGGRQALFYWPAARHVRDLSLVSKRHSSMTLPF